MIAWLTTHSFADVPRWMWGAAFALFIAETILGRSSDPRWRSLGDSLRNLLGMLLAKVPVGGPILVQWLQAIFVVPTPPPAPALDAVLSKTVIDRTPGNPGAGSP